MKNTQGTPPSITDLRALRERIAGKAKLAQPVTNSTALLETLKSQDFMAQVGEVLPAGSELTGERFIQSVLRALERDERLMACEPRSVLGAALRSAEIGLAIGGVLQHAFLIPRSRRDGRGGFAYEAELTLGYRGMIKLARRAGRVKSIVSHVVTDREIEEERFCLIYEGEKDVFSHEPILYGDMGEPVLVYCLVRFDDGSFHIETMSKQEIERIKEVAVANWTAMDGESPWITNEMEMWRKSPIRRAFKYLDIQLESLDLAVRVEEEVERGKAQNLASLIDVQEPTKDATAPTQGGDSGAGQPTDDSAAQAGKQGAAGPQGQAASAAAPAAAAAETLAAETEKPEVQAASPGQGGHQAAPEGAAAGSAISAVQNSEVANALATPAAKRRPGRPRKNLVPVGDESKPGGTGAGELITARATSPGPDSAAPQCSQADERPEAANDPSQAMGSDQGLTVTGKGDGEEDAAGTGTELVSQATSGVAGDGALVLGEVTQVKIEGAGAGVGEGGSVAEPESQALVTVEISGNGEAGGTLRGGSVSKEVFDDECDSVAFIPAGSLFEH